MQIGKISLHTTRVAKTASNNATINQLATNPFGVSFKGNVIQADVFEGASKSNIAENIAEKGKLFASAVVSGINNFNESFKSRMNSVVSFGKKVTTNVFDTIERIGNTEITFDMTGLKNKLFPDRQYSVKNLANKPVDELKSMWTDLSAVEVA
ncbi:MAG: hypothetical protein E7Z90_07100 [Cyanobacteria bacterium SIG29]|nr:hypothetical protein [Cyanobacteria bacterium SIG29]